MSDFVFDDMPAPASEGPSSDPFGGGVGGEENLAWSQPVDTTNTFPSSEPPQPQQWSSGGGDTSFVDNDSHQHQHHEEQQSSWQMPEPEQDDALSAFNKQWQITLDAKRTAETEAEKAVKAKAAEEMANWHTQRDIRLRAKKVQTRSPMLNEILLSLTFFLVSKDANRSEEQVLLETLESDVDVNNWERLAKLIDAGDAGETSKADVSQMYKLFIALKNEPLESTRAGSTK